MTANKGGVLSLWRYGRVETGAIMVSPNTYCRLLLVPYTLESGSDWIFTFSFMYAPRRAQRLFE